MKIIAIIVTYNATKWIDNCFGSLINSSLSMDIAVFDNNSSDDTVSLIRKKFPEVEIHETGKNLGFGKANNLGLKIALKENYDYAFLLNQDAWLEVDTVEKLMTNHLNNKEYGVIVPLQMNGEGKLIDSLFLKYTIGENRELISNVFKGNSNRLYSIDFANAACWLLPISTVKEIGGFDPLFPHYGEDDDYLNRVKYHNYKIGLDLTSLVFHDRENRIPKTSMKAVVNDTFTRELIVYKNLLISIKSKKHLIKSVFKSGIKYFTSAFDKYYLYKIISYIKIYKLYDSILENRKQEVEKFQHYL